MDVFFCGLTSGLGGYRTGGRCARLKPGCGRYFVSIKHWMGRGGWCRRARAPSRPAPANPPRTCVCPAQSPVRGHPQPKPPALLCSALSVTMATAVLTGPAPEWRRSSLLRSSPSTDATTTRPRCHLIPPMKAVYQGNLVRSRLVYLCSSAHRCQSVISKCKTCAVGVRRTEFLAIYYSSLSVFSCASRPYIRSQVKSFG